MRSNSLTGAPLTDTRVHTVTDADGRHTGFLEGTLSTGEVFRLDLTSIGAKRRLVVRSGDAGAVARAFGIYGNARGGRLRMEAILHDDLPDRPITDTVTIHNYRVVNAPTLAELLSVATLTRILDRLRGEGIAVSTFIMPFAIVNDVPMVEDAEAADLSIGLNAEGTVDLETERADISGTIVPAYAVNSIVGTIPLLGELLVGGEGEGGVRGDLPGLRLDRPADRRRKPARGAGAGLPPQPVFVPRRWQCGRWWRRGARLTVSTRTASSGSRIRSLDGIADRFALRGRPLPMGTRSYARSSSWRSAGSATVSACRLRRRRSPQTAPQRLLPSFQAARSSAHPQHS